MTIGKRIRELRVSRSYSQEYLAEKLGVSRQAVSKWETDLSAPDTYNLIALSKLFGVSVEYIAIGECKAENEAVCAESSSGVGIKSVVGSILLGAGVLSLILGILFSELLILISVYLVVGGILCISLKKNLGIVLLWVFIAMSFIIFSTFTTINVFGVFFANVLLKAFKGEFTIGVIFSCVFWICVVTAVAISLASIIKKRYGKRP